MLLQENDLELLPYAAVALRGATVSAVNSSARTLLPDLDHGHPLPESFSAALTGEHSAGSFCAGNVHFHFLRLSAGDCQLVLFRPAQEGTLTDTQMEAFFRQMRGFLGEEFNRLQLNNAQPHPRSGRDFHRALRTMNDLEFLRIPMEQAQTLFQPATLDLAGLCMDTCRQAAPLLRPRGTKLSYTGSCTGLLIPGDPELLQRLLLTLIARAACGPAQQLCLSVTPRFERAVVTLSGGMCGDVFSAKTSPDAIPAPGEDQSLSLDVAQRIAALHNGTLLLNDTGGGTNYALSLPTGPIFPSAPLKTPKMEQNGGISPFLLELSDLLPESFFEEGPQ